MQIYSVQPHGIDIAPLPKVFTQERFVYHQPAAHIGIDFYHGESLESDARRHSLRYQYAWEKTDTGFLLIIHHDCLFSVDAVAGRSRNKRKLEHNPI